MLERVRRRHYIFEALIYILAAELAVRFLSPAFIFQFAGRPPRFQSRFKRYEVPWVVWAVRTVSIRYQGRSLVRTLAAQAMLRRRGIASGVCIAGGSVGAKVMATVWLEIDGEVAMGHAEANSTYLIARLG